MAGHHDCQVARHAATEVDDSQAACKISETQFALIAIEIQVPPPQHPMPTSRSVPSGWRLLEIKRPTILWVDFSSIGIFVEVFSNASENISLLSRKTVHLFTNTKIVIFKEKGLPGVRVNFAARREEFRLGPLFRKNRTSLRSETCFGPRRYYTR